MWTWCCRGLLLFILFAFQFERGLAAEAGCNLQTLRGTYIFATTGWSKLEKDYKPVAYIGMLSFDGKGKVLSRFRYDTDKNAKLSKGSYTVAKNCEAEITLTNGRKAVYFVNPNGESYSFVVISGLVASGDVRRISKEMLLKVK